MRFHERLRALRNQKMMTQEELARAAGVSAVTVRSWESGAKCPSMNAIISLAETFGVSADYMLGIARDGEMDFRLLSRRERTLLTDFRELDSHGKRIVETLCRMERQRIDDAPGIRIAGVQKTAGRRAPGRLIPLYATPSAAGVSVPLDGEECEMIAADENVPERADFAVRISGHSMEPWILDGETVYAERTGELRNGEIGIFAVDGAMYCKQYFVDAEGNLSLLSANPAEAASSIFRSADQNPEDVVCYGRVLKDGPEAGDQRSISFPLPGSR